MFELHPGTQKLFPKFANIPIANLANNKEFLIQTQTCMSGFFFIVNSLGNDQLLSKALTQQSSHALVSYVDPAEQFDVIAYTLT